MDATREHYIRVGKDAAWQAYGHRERYNESPISYFDGAHRSQAQRRTATRRRVHVTHANATRNSGSSKPPVPEDLVMQGGTLRAIADLSPLQCTWVQYRYREPGIARTERGESFRRAYFERYKADWLSKCNVGTREMARYFTEFVMEGCRGDPKPPGCHIDPQNWGKTYKPHFTRIKSEIAEIDADAMHMLGLSVDQGGRE
jgi:hypothetical protein